MIAALVIVWALGALGALQLQVAIIRDDPSAMPGGGRPAVVLRALLWPLVLVLAVIFLVVTGASGL